MIKAWFLIPWLLAGCNPPDSEISRHRATYERTHYHSTPWDISTPVGAREHPEDGKAPTTVNPQPKPAWR
jgi:hypothetical protein